MSRNCQEIVKAESAKKREKMRKLRLTNIPDHVIVETMKTIIDDARREFIAKIVADLGKTIFAVGLASYFFERFPVSIRVTLSILSIVFLVTSVFIHPRKGGD